MGLLSTVSKKKKYLNYLKNLKKNSHNFLATTSSIKVVYCVQYKILLKYILILKLVL